MDGNVDHRSKRWLANNKPRITRFVGCIFAYAVFIWRYLNVPLGLAVAVWPWFVGDSTLALNIISTVSGLAVAALSIPRGTLTEKYGLWAKYVR